MYSWLVCNKPVAYVLISLGHFNTFAVTPCRDKVESACFLVSVRLWDLFKLIRVSDYVLNIISKLIGDCKDFSHENRSKKQVGIKFSLWKAHFPRNRYFLIVNCHFFPDFLILFWNSLMIYLVVPVVSWSLSCCLFVCLF